MRAVAGDIKAIPHLLDLEVGHLALRRPDSFTQVCRAL
jgi:hypothetical protein